MGRQEHTTSRPPDFFFSVSLATLQLGLTEPWYNTPVFGSRALQLVKKMICFRRPASHTAHAGHAVNHYDSSVDPGCALAADQSAARTVRLSSMLWFKTRVSVFRAWTARPGFGIMARHHMPFIHHSQSPQPPNTLPNSGQRIGAAADRGPWEEVEGQEYGYTPRITP